MTHRGTNEQEAALAPGPVWTGAENLSKNVIKSLVNEASNHTLYQLQSHGARAPRKEEMRLKFHWKRKSFSVHIQERLIAAVRCINDIKNLQLLSLKTAIRLFEVKVLPTLTYGLESIWDHLSVKQLESIWDHLSVRQRDGIRDQI